MHATKNFFEEIRFLPQETSALWLGENPDINLDFSIGISRYHPQCWCSLNNLHAQREIGSRTHASMTRILTPISPISVFPTWPGYWAIRSGARSGAQSGGRSGTRRTPASLSGSYSLPRVYFRLTNHENAVKTANPDSLLLFPQQSTSPIFDHYGLIGLASCVIMTTDSFITVCRVVFFSGILYGGCVWRSVLASASATLFFIRTSTKIWASEIEITTNKITMMSLNIGHFWAWRP